MNWLSKLNRSEFALFVITFSIFLISTSARIIQQNDFNLLWFYILIYLVTFAIVYLGSIILYYIPFVPRIISSIIGGVFIIMIIGFQILPSIVIVILTVFLAYIWNLMSSKNYSKIKLSISLTISVLLSISLFIYLLSDGFYDTLPQLGQRIDSSSNHLVEDIKDYEIKKFTYGSGKDLYRSEFANEVTIQTKTIDGSDFIQNWDGFSGNYRTNYWGFDSKALPLNSYVWMTKGDGKSPLVLIVHGDHAMQDYSEKGYEYLAEKLAKKGYIVASVDQNFLNRSWSDLLLTDPLLNDHATRGWLLLEHLKLWQNWNSDATSFLYNKVDMSNIALIGHSRGGEAVSIAATFNKLKAFPENPSIKFNYNFNIKSIVGIAPTDGWYRPQDEKPIELNYANYLLLHGTHDGEMHYAGIGQYSRTYLKKDNNKLKTAIYIFGANHSQFNTSWGSNDHEFFQPFSTKWDYDLLMSAKKQQEITKSSILAFLELTLKNKEKYRETLRSPMDYVSESICLSQYQTASDTILFNFENGKNEFITTNNVVLKNKWIGLGANALELEWQKKIDNEVESSVSFKTSSPTKDNQKLRFDLSNGTDFPINFTIQVSYQNGEKISFSLNKSGKMLPARFKRALKKVDNFNNNIKSEIAFETFTFDISNTKKEVSISVIKFIFNANQNGIIYIDNLGFEQPIY